VELVKENDTDYLMARNDEGVSMKIRLDLIRNMPTPVK